MAVVVAMAVAVAVAVAEAEAEEEEEVVVVVVVVVAAVAAGVVVVVSMQMKMTSYRCRRRLIATIRLLSLLVLLHGPAIATYHHGRATQNVAKILFLSPVSWESA